MIVFHEQVMRTLAALAGYDLTYADHIRRHLDDEAMLPALRADFLDAGGRARRRSARPRRPRGTRWRSSRRSGSARRTRRRSRCRPTARRG